MFVCAICQCEISDDLPVLICSECKARNIKKYMRAWKFAELLRKGKTEEEIKEENSATFYFFWSARRKIKKMINPVYVMGKTVLEVEEMLKKIRQKGKIKKGQKLDSYLKDYLQKRYGGVQNYFDSKDCSDEWRNELKKLAKKVGHANITEKIVQQHNPELLRRIKAIGGINYCCEVTGIRKKHANWTQEKIIKKIIKMVSHNKNLKPYQIKEKLGTGFIVAAKRVFPEDDLSNLIMYAQRSLIREEKTKTQGLDITEHVNLIHSVVLKFFKHHRADPFFLEEMVTEGMLGLMRALEKYDSSTFGVKWSTYAWGWIRGSIGRSLEKFHPERLIVLPSHRVNQKDFETSEYKVSSLNKMMEDGQTEKIDMCSSFEENPTRRLEWEDIYDCVREEFGEEGVCLLKGFLFLGERRNKKLEKIFKFLRKPELFPEFEYRFKKQ